MDQHKDDQAERQIPPSVLQRIGIYPGVTSLPQYDREGPSQGKKQGGKDTPFDFQCKLSLFVGFAVDFALDPFFGKPDIEYQIKYSCKKKIPACNYRPK